MRKRHIWTDREKDSMKRMREEGVIWRDIALHFRVTEAAAVQQGTNLGLVAVRERSIGEPSEAERLWPLDVRDQSWNFAVAGRALGVDRALRQQTLRARAR